MKKMPTGVTEIIVLDLEIEDNTLLQSEIEEDPYIMVQIIIDSDDDYHLTVNTEYEQ